VASAAVALAVTASAAGPTVALNLKGGSANRVLVACGIRHHYTFFPLRRPFSMGGVVQPVPPARWRVKVKVKKCIRGRFRTVWARHANGKSDGTFKIAYTPRRAGSYFARAYYYGVRPAARSDKQYFRAP
jgi:hypothetical protein